MRHSKLPRLRVNLFGYHFSPGWIPTLATVLLFPLLISLGAWQLKRADEKRLLEKEFGRNTQIDLQALHGLPPKAWHYHLLRAVGEFDDKHIILLDNKTYHHAFGYQVFVPFLLPKQHKALLINRGFIAVPDRKTLPFIPPPRGLHTLQGLIDFPKKSFILKTITTPTTWPLLVQSIDFPDLEKRLGVSLYPFYLLETGAKEGNLVQDWHPVNFPSYRHTGYAVQWFLLAITLLVLYIRLNTSRRTD